MSKQQYFEAHITMEGDPAWIENSVTAARALHAFPSGWKFSCISGDANLGSGVKCYLTKQMNTKIGEDYAIKALMATADLVAGFKDVKVLRRKIELVLWDDRISTVPCVAEECAHCAEPS